MQLQKKPNILSDQDQRRQALDTHQSFIVQAPAGSGKTELLVQRYLALLSQVSSPEAVLAITFTRKAAAEMRRRVLDALQMAAAHPNPPTDTSIQARWRLARKLQAWQMQQQWNLIANPNRLRIQTIDAFYAGLARQMPLLSGVGFDIEISENPTLLYHAAVRALFEQQETATEIGSALTHVLQHLDNDYSTAEQLLVHLLHTRDQWLSIVEAAQALPALRKHLEASLQYLRQTQEQALESAFEKGATLTANWRLELKKILDFSREMQALPSLVEATNNRLLSKPEFCPNSRRLTDEERNLLGVNEYRSQPNNEEVGQKTLFPKQSNEAFWLSVADLLLTAKGEWRKRLGQQQGFPALSSLKNPAQKTRLKILRAQVNALLDNLQSHESIRLALLAFRARPPATYTDVQWALLQALFQVLQALIKCLDQVFQARQQVDYIAVSLGALRALGEENHPTDLTLALDYQIQHILIDEFQDTSIPQFIFLRRLTEGWEPQDGRTLFLVGDPMQSIYRFRKADARLFAAVQQYGIGTCTLRSLSLSANFRSTAALVHWINTHFESITTSLPTQWQSSVSFKPAIAALPKTPSRQQSNLSDAVQTHWLKAADSDQEAEWVMHLVQAALTSQTTPRPHIAILGRARRHLVPILAKLRSADIPHQAIDMEALAEKPAIQDLLALTRALVHLADETAWLAILRAPWCGLLLQDLDVLMQACRQTSNLIWDQLQALDQLELTSDGYSRLDRLVAALKPAVIRQGRQVLHQRVRTAWLSLGGPACLQLPLEEMQDVDIFFQHLDRFQQREDVVDCQALEATLQQVYIHSTSKIDHAQVSVMTIHKAKGLEFDTVILMGLHRGSRADTQPLLRFEEILSPTGPRLLIAPMKPRDTTLADPIYQYLQNREQQQAKAEAIRLLYVACTRAKKQLHLVASLQVDATDLIQLPKTDHLLRILWPTLEPLQQTLSDHFALQKSPLHNEPSQRWLRRMSLDSRLLSKPIFCANSRPLTDEARHLLGVNEDRSQPNNAAVGQKTPFPKQSSHYPIASAATVAQSCTTQAVRWQAHPTRATGTVIHQLLCRLANEGLSQTALAAQHTQLIDRYQPFIKTLLLQAGGTPLELDHASKQVTMALNNTLQDERGRWIVAADHQSAQSEYGLTTIEEGVLRQYIIDRTFVDTADTRWIIDYKTTRQIPNNIQDFLDQQVSRHSPQLMHYAQVIQHLPCQDTAAASTIRLGLYWPLLGLWHEWAA